MFDAQATTGLEMRWVPVTDAAGRTRMETRWVDVTAPAATLPAPQTHAA